MLTMLLEDGVNAAGSVVTGFAGADRGYADARAISVNICALGRQTDHDDQWSPWGQFRHPYESTRLQSVAGHLCGGCRGLKASQDKPDQRREQSRPHYALRCACQPCQWFVSAVVIGHDLIALSLGMIAP